MSDDRECSSGGGTPPPLNSTGRRIEKRSKSKRTLRDSSSESPQRKRRCNDKSNRRRKNARRSRKCRKTDGDSIVTSCLEIEGRDSKSLDDIRKEVKLKVTKEQYKQKKLFDQRRRQARKYEVGDLVRIEREICNNNGKSKKLLPKLQGPYRIIKILDHDRYIVQDTPLTRKHNRKYEAVIAADKIYPWLTYTQEYLDDEYDNDGSKKGSYNNLSDDSDDEVVESNDSDKNCNISSKNDCTVNNDIDNDTDDKA
ncbi:hypothetical protein ACJJTC_004113 [Scirpophaga incertulas]